MNEHITTQVVTEKLSDGSEVFAILIKNGEGRHIKIDCVSQKAAVYAQSMFTPLIRTAEGN